MTEKIGPLLFNVEARAVHDCHVCQGFGKVFIYEGKLRGRRCDRCKKLWSIVNEAQSINLFNKLNEITHDHHGRTVDELITLAECDRKLVRKTLNVLLEYGDWSAMKIYDETIIYGEGSDAHAMLAI